MGPRLLHRHGIGQALLVRIPVVFAAITAVGVVGCGSSPSADSAAQHAASASTVGARASAAAASTALTSTAPSASASTGAVATPAAAATGGDASIQSFGEQVFALAATNRARLNKLIVTPSEVSGETCIAVYSNQGYAIAAKTQDANMSEIPPVNTPVALVSACERGTTIVQIATSNTVDAQSSTSVIDALWPDPLFSLVTGDADGSNTTSTHVASQQTMVNAAFTALDHLEGLLGISA